MNLLFVFGVVAVIALGFVVAMHQEKKRREALAQLASQMGLTYRPDGDEQLRLALNSFPLFNQGRSRQLTNLLQGEINSLPVSIFDYKYVTGSGKQSHSWHQTVLCFTLKDRALPSFTLRPESVFDKIGQWFGSQDIDFPTHPNFSKIYLLRGEDETAIRRLFTDSMKSFYEQNPRLCTEGHGSNLLVYQIAVRVKPEQLVDHLQLGLNLLRFYAPSATAEEFVVPPPRLDAGTGAERMVG